MDPYRKTALRTFRDVAPFDHDQYSLEDYPLIPDNENDRLFNDLDYGQIPRSEGYYSTGSDGK
jgi:hypothetical protein